ncbi:hypothetical protein Bca4012_103472 [Brassica carinata]
MRDEPEAGYGAQLRANLEPTKGVGRLRQRGGGHGSRNPLRTCPPWKRLSGGRVSGWKSTAASRGVGAFRPLKIRRTECAHAGRTHNASGLQVRTRRLLAGCLSASVASGPPRVGGGGLGAALRELSRAALNVKVKKFNQARVNGGSNYDSLKRNHSQGAGLAESAGKEDPVELDSSPTL